MATKVSENKILQCLLKSIEESIPINFDKRKIEWGKSLEGMPVFTVREIEDHKKESGKNGATIEKRSERSLQFKNELYLNADTIQSMKAKDLFKFKGICHTIMKKNALFWLVAVPSGLISDKNIPEQFGIVLIKSPKPKRNFDPFVLLQDSSFCVEKLDTDLLCLKQKHSDGYYEEIQMCMGLSGVSYAALFITLSVDT